MSQCPATIYSLRPRRSTARNESQLHGWHLGRENDRGTDEGAPRGPFFLLTALAEATGLLRKQALVYTYLREDDCVNLVVGEGDDVFQLTRARNPHLEAPNALNHGST